MTHVKVQLAIYGVLERESTQVVACEGCDIKRYPFQSKCVGLLDTCLVIPNRSQDVHAEEAYVFLIRLNCSKLLFTSQILSIKLPLQICEGLLISRAGWLAMGHLTVRDLVWRLHFTKAPKAQLSILWSF